MNKKNDPKPKKNNKKRIDSLKSDDSGVDVVFVDLAAPAEASAGFEHLLISLRMPREQQMNICSEIYMILFSGSKMEEPMRPLVRHQEKSKVIYV